MDLSQAREQILRLLAQEALFELIGGAGESSLQQLARLRKGLPSLDALSDEELLDRVPTLPAAAQIIARAAAALLHSKVAQERAAHAIEHGHPFLNQWQQVALSTVAGGSYAHLLRCEREAHLQAGLAAAPMVRAILHELSTTDDDVTILSPEAAADRLQAIIEDQFEPAVRELAQLDVYVADDHERSYGPRR